MRDEDDPHASEERDVTPGLSPGSVKTRPPLRGGLVFPDQLSPTPCIRAQRPWSLLQGVPEGLCARNGGAVGCGGAWRGDPGVGRGAGSVGWVLGGGQECAQNEPKARREQLETAHRIRSGQGFSDQAGQWGWKEQCMHRGEGLGRQSSVSWARRIARPRACICFSNATSIRSWGSSVRTEGSER